MKLSIKSASIHYERSAYSMRVLDMLTSNSLKTWSCRSNQFPSIMKDHIMPCVILKCQHETAWKRETVNKNSFHQLWKVVLFHACSRDVNIKQLQNVCIDWITSITSIYLMWLSKLSTKPASIHYERLSYSMRALEMLTQNNWKSWNCRSNQLPSTME